MLEDFTWLSRGPINSVADPGFPRGGGANSPGGGRQHTILPNFPINCMKLKEFGPGGGRASKILLCKSATGTSLTLLSTSRRS